MKTEIEKKFSPLERINIKVIRGGFEDLAQGCEYQFTDDEGMANCRYHPSSIGLCKAKFCPRLTQGDEKDGAGRD